MADRIIDIIVRAKDEASRELKALSDKAGESINKISNYAGIAGVALGAFSVVAIKGAADAQFSQKQLEHAVIDVSHATKEQLDATSNLADELERKGVLDGDNIKQGLAQLSTFGLSNDAVRGLGGSLADLAVNQHGVSASGEQLTESANMIAKALNGQFGVLEKSGIRFTEAQQHMIKFGTETEKVTALNEGFAQNLKTTNATALQTFSGQMAHLNTQIGNLVENIGTALMPFVTKLADALRPVIDAVGKWTSENPAATASIIAVAGAILGIIFIVPKLITGINGIGTALKLMAANPVITIIAAIVIVITVLVTLWTTNEDFRKAVIGIWNTISKFIGDNMKKISDFIRIGLQFIKDLWMIEWTYFIQPIIELWKAIIGFFIEQWANLKNTINEGLGNAKKAWDGFWQGMYDTVDRIIKSMLGIIGKVGDAINGAVNGVKNAANFVGGGISAAKNAVGGAVGAVGNFFAGKRASGGPVEAGGTYLVGERGPELLKMGRSSGNVTSNDQLGSTQVIITGNTLLDSQAAIKIGNMIMGQLRLQRKLN